MQVGQDYLAYNLKKVGTESSLGQILLSDLTLDTCKQNKTKTLPIL